MSVREEDNNLFRIGARVLQCDSSFLKTVVSLRGSRSVQRVDCTCQTIKIRRQICHNLGVVIALSPTIIPISVVTHIIGSSTGKLHQRDAVLLALVGNLRVLVGRRLDEVIDRGLERVNLRRLVPSNLFGHRAGHIQHQHDVERLVRHNLARTRALRTGDVQCHLVCAVSIGGNGLLAGRSRQRRIIWHTVCSLSGKRNRHAGGRLLIGGLRLCCGGIPIVRHGGGAYPSHAGDAAEHRHGGNDGH